MEDERAGHTACSAALKQLIHHIAGIAVMDAHIAKLFIGHMLAPTCHAIQIIFCADMQLIGVIGRLPGQMLARAKANFQPYVALIHPAVKAVRGHDGFVGSRRILAQGPASMAAIEISSIFSHKKREAETSLIY